ncbi:23S rRNA (adenine(2503)-C(2))-methyltransferase RlmN [Anaerotignum propionicum]|uniref:23S rRNA (adenine(2503)-C(2))-methyltransferase RlmN n=1 Tax=Anaerotignum propionicum TaxID=28446 RepID=UPI002109097E|nr:23S rRNA (adenine(2503)-C(2))-methyltransferase RlmN [Anaerotignum propionicum]MCQ4936896.1 23S rRNA (adenine(2503)-C(2))-methyltransferase RlmN [Anaerotignum propionicum]
MAKNDLKSMSLEELQLFLADMKEPKFRGKQVFEWIHKKQVSSFDEMTNLSKSLREKLQQNAVLGGVEMVRRLISQVDGTRKYLFALENDSVIESVLMKYEHGNTVCISTQAGCRMGCKFCASTLDGVERNLTAGEMLSQVYEIQKDCGERISGVVLMGSGEPLDNYENVVKFIHLINHPDGQNMGQRHITLSTCGLIEKMYQLEEEHLQITLAVSLHAPNDEIRKSIMPVAKANSMDRLLVACRDYAEKTKRRITFEYAMMRGVNDSDDCAKELAKKLRDTLCHVNLIPVNDVKERDYIKSSNDRVKQFATLLQENGVETTIRRKLGSDIDAACGQLRRSHLKDKRELS